ncbi:MAG: putative transrane sensory transduction histidine kinase for metal resistance [Pseudonocardiales bacterium]|nr:putative transrane sensory transduction histidine kinase for metal resistance [Jatrophihabitantaceae bacterium]MCW2602384.1 putative transrane sensory transduction histidine kinase for metal resistance [Pseudonocardiales bacterium]
MDTARRRLGGLRIRLALVYTIAAAMLVTAGALSLSFLLHRGLVQNVDAALTARSEQVGQSADPVGPDPLPGSSGDLGERFATVTQVYDAQGRLTASQPTALPALLSADRAQAAGVDDRISTITYDGTRIRALVRSLGSDREGAILLVGASLSQVNDDAGDIDGALALAAPILVVLAGAGTWLLSGAALRPVERMRSDAADLRASGADRRLTVPATRDELESLGHTLNDLLDGLHGALRQQRDFVADAGHELRTPLAVLRTELELADRPGRTPEELRDSIQHAAREVDRLSDLANSLLELARADSHAAATTAEAVDVSALIDDAARAHRAAADSAGIELIVDYPPGLSAVADPASLRRVLDNVVSNALAHTPRHGTVVIAAGRADAIDGAETDALRITIGDTGPGMPDAFLPHAFERFSRSDSARSRRPDQVGTGLGLAIVGAIMTAHGGSAAARNLPAGGLEITLLLPRAQPAAG